MSTLSNPSFDQPNPGDLGRRTKQRREELGLTSKEVADRAGMAPEYLSYLERSAATGVAPATIVRLAAALETSPILLVGGSTQVPPGQASAGRHPVLESLTEKECIAFMSPGGVGRIGFYGGERGTVIIPVNYRMFDGDVVFRTVEDSSLAEVSKFDLIAFEVDHFDDALSEGWSVLFSGQAHLVLSEHELAQVVALGDEPWAGGTRNSYVRLEMSEISGRRIRVQT